MQYIGSIILLIFLIISLKMHKRIISPIVLINLLFFSIFFLLCLKPFEIKTDNEEAYFIILLGMTMVNIGFYLLNNLNLNKKNYYCAYEIRNFVLLIILAVLVFFSISYLNEMIRLKEQGYSLNMIRLFYFQSSEFLYDTTGIYRNSFIAFGTTYLYMPCQYLSIALTSLLIFSPKFVPNKKLRLATIFITLANLIFSMVTNGGRVIIYYFFICLALSYIIYNIINKKNKKINNKTSILFRISVITGIILLLYFATFISVNRTENDQFKMVQSIYYYFSGSIPNMQIKLEKFGFGDYTNGLVFISGLVRPLFTGLRFIFGIPIPNAFNITDQFLYDASLTELIGGGQQYNAFVTMFYFFFRDAGFVGVILESFLLGNLLALIYNSFTNDYNNPRKALLYMVMIEGLSISFVRWQIMSVGYALAFIIIFFLFKKKVAVIKG